MSQTLADLSIGSKVKFGKYQVNTEDSQPIIWTIVAKNHTGYPENSVTLHATEILDLRCFDAIEPNNSDSNRAEYGNNRYSLSNIDQWLNKNATANAWYSATHTADHSPDTSAGVGDYGTQYASHPGFLNGFTDDEKNAILSTTIRVVKSSTDGSPSYEDITRKVFLPSVTEVAFSDEQGIAEGAAWGCYTNDASRVGYTTQQCFDNSPSSSKPSSKTTGWSWWLRTPSRSTQHRTWSDSSTGASIVDFVNNGSVGVRPALNLASSLLVSDTSDSDGCYTFVWNTVPVASDVTIHGTTYTGVTSVRYVKNGVTKEVDKLVLNGSTIWSASGGTTPVEPTFPEKKAFSEMTWADIQTVCKAGKASEYWAIGDTRLLGNENSNKICIIGFDHDTPADTASYGRSKAGITVETSVCFGSTVKMNTASSTAGGWKECSARTSLFAQLPSALGLEDYIVPVVKLCSTGGSSGQTIEEVTDSVFLLSEVEVHGTTAYSIEGEGTQYVWYEDNDAKKGTLSSTDPVIRWTRSPYSSRYYACVTTTGGSYYYAATGSRNMTIAFCI